MPRVAIILVLVSAGVLCRNSGLLAQTAVESLLASEGDLSGKASVTAKESAKIPANVLNAIKLQAAKSHADDYSTQRYVIKVQSEAYQELVALKCPKDVPENVFKKIVTDASRGHSSDYSTQLYVINSQTNAYRELVAFDWPTDIPKNTLRAIAAKAYRSYRTDYRTQLYVIRTQIKAYHQLSTVGN